MGRKAERPDGASEPPKVCVWDNALHDVLPYHRREDALGQELGREVVDKVWQVLKQAHPHGAVGLGKHFHHRPNHLCIFTTRNATPAVLVLPERRSTHDLGRALLPRTLLSYSSGDSLAPILMSGVSAFDPAIANVKNATCWHTKCQR